MGKGGSNQKTDSFQSQYGTSSQYFGQQGNSPFAGYDASLAQQFFGMAGYPLKSLLGDINKALNGKVYQLPLVQQATSAAMAATAAGLQGTEGQFAQAGLGQGPLERSLFAGQRMQGNEQVSQIPADIARMFIGMAPGVIGETLGVGTNLISQATQADFTRQGQTNSFSHNTSRGFGTQSGSSGFDLSGLVGDLFTAGQAAGLF